MAQYILFGPEGLPLYFYDDATYPPEQDGSKSKLIPADAVPVTPAQWDDASRGRLYRKPDGTITTPPPPDAAPQPERAFSFLEFMDLFTPAEQASLAGAAMTDVQIKLWYDRAMGAQGIFMSDQRTIDGVQIMVSSNLLTPQRGQMVLKGVVP